MHTDFILSHPSAEVHHTSHAAKSGLQRRRGTNEFQAFLSHFLQISIFCYRSTQCNAQQLGRFGTAEPSFCIAAAAGRALKEKYLRARGYFDEGPLMTTNVRIRAMIGSLSAYGALIPLFHCGMFLTFVPLEVNTSRSPITSKVPFGRLGWLRTLS